MRAPMLIKVLLFYIVAMPISVEERPFKITYRWRGRRSLKTWVGGSSRDPLEIRGLFTRPSPSRQLAERH